jgi:hypothetical protein
MYRDILPEELKLNSAIGYLYFIDKYHPLAHGKAKWVYYHRHVVSISVGRWITSEEVVHHKDHNKLNNSLDNLDLLSKSEHTKMHFPKELPNVVCPICKTEFSPIRWTQKYCSSGCGHKSREKLPEMSKEELEYLIWHNSLSSLVPILGMSDNGIKKLAIRLGCLMPPPRFHVKYISLAAKHEQYELKLL